jgi:hypothetical protein
MQPKFEFSKPIKGMIFAGCSFTWGQGLYYYSNLENLTDAHNPWGYDPRLYTSIHHRYKETVRFPRIVANHFNSFEILQPKNGGSNEQIVNYWRNCFTNRNWEYKLNSFHPGEFDSLEKIDYREVSYVVFQLTQFQRDHFVIEDGDGFINIPLQWWWNNDHKQKYRNIFYKYLEKNNISPAEVNERMQIKSLERVKKFLMECEDNGVKTYILSWPKEFLEFIKKDPWLIERHITFNYNNKNYKSIEELMDDNECLEIRKDYDTFIVPPQDCHPSLKCHQIIAESIIKFMEKKKNLI